MNFTQQYSKRLNVNICPETYGKIKQFATMEGRKVGNMARQILDRWARNSHEKTDDEDKKLKIVDNKMLN